MNVSVVNMIPTYENVDTNVVSKVFVLYTGGTIGMTRNQDDILVIKDLIPLLLKLIWLTWPDYFLVRVKKKKNFFT